MKIAFTFGRMNPPTAGHERIIHQLHKLERGGNVGEVRVYLTHTTDSTNNPLTYKEKLRYAQSAFGSIVHPSRSKTIIDVMKELEREAFNSVIMVAGSDRAAEFERLLLRYNGTEYYFEDIQVISAGQRDPDSAGVSGISASKLRQYAVDGDLVSFLSAVPSRLSGRLAKEMYLRIRSRMGVSEQSEDQENVLTENVAKDIARRRKRARTMKRLAPRIKRGAKRAKKRMPSADTVDRRARARARRALRAELAGRGKSWDKLPYSQRRQIDQRIKKKKNLLDKSALRMRRKVRADLHKRARRSKKKESFIGNNLNYYAERAIAKITSILNDAASKTISEKAPSNPKAEKWIKDNKEQFKQRYGDEWQKYLYGKAWKMFGDEKEDKNVSESAEYKGKKVELDKSFRTPDGPKKFAVYVKNEKGNVVIVRFGDPNMEIKADDPNRRKAFRARHNCDNPGPKTSARYWSCKMW